MWMASYIQQRCIMWREIERERGDFICQVDSPCNIRLEEYNGGLPDYRLFTLADKNVLGGWAWLTPVTLAMIGWSSKYVGRLQFGEMSPTWPTFFFMSAFVGKCEHAQAPTHQFWPPSDNNQKECARSRDANRRRAVLRSCAASNKHN